MPGRAVRVYSPTENPGSSRRRVWRARNLRQERGTLPQAAWPLPAVKSERDAHQAFTSNEAGSDHYGEPFG
jgi:hypothetical protein